MNSLQIFAFQSPQIISWGDSVFNNFKESITQEKFDLQDGDIVIITSKVVSMEEQARVELDKVDVSDKAKELADSAKMDPRFVQIVLDEAEGQIFGSVYHAILAKTRYGLSANAGIDQSNCPEGYVLLLPRDPDLSARRYRQLIKEQYGKDVAVIITDSRTIPLKWGTIAVALGIAGMDPLKDERGKQDLYGYEMTITTRAIADSLASAANLLMGETNERTPFVIIRGYPYDVKEEVSMQSAIMSENKCLYFAPFMQLLGKRNDNSR